MNVPLCLSGKNYLEPQVIIFSAPAYTGDRGGDWTERQSKYRAIGSTPVARRQGEAQVLYGQCLCFWPSTSVAHLLSTLLLKFAAGTLPWDSCAALGFRHPSVTFRRLLRVSRCTGWKRGTCTYHTSACWALVARRVPCSHTPLALHSETAVLVSVCFRKPCIHPRSTLCRKGSGSGSPPARGASSAFLVQLCWCGSH